MGMAGLFSFLASDGNTIEEKLVDAALGAGGVAASKHTGMPWHDALIEALEIVFSGEISNFFNSNTGCSYSTD